MAISTTYGDASPVPSPSSADMAMEGGGGDAVANHAHEATEADTAPWSDLWTGGLVCAFEFVRGHGRGHGFASSPYLSRTNSSRSMDLPVITGSGSSDRDEPRPAACRHGRAAPAESYWFPIEWARITELVAMVDGGDTAAWDDELQGVGLTDAQSCCDDDITVTVPYLPRLPLRRYSVHPWSLLPAPWGPPT